jgi:alkylation response protein AidB-like acyl-CoA dehydrogenase
MATDRGYDTEVWKRIALEMGWPAILIPEEYDGLGLTYVELVALLEETGRALLCSPFFSTVCLGVNALLVAASDEQKAAYLPGIAEGEMTATLAFTEANGRWDATGVEAVARRDGNEYVLAGVKKFVPDGHTADLLIVAARDEGTRGEDGIGLFAVPAETEGVERRLLATMDQTRKQAEVTLRDVRLPGSARLGGAGADASGWAALEKVLHLAAVAIAAEQVGGAQQCLDDSVAYAKERIQFGRPIASFQAIKHKCADMMVRVESARSASYYAACMAAEDSAQLAEHASLAKAYCSDTFFQCAAENIQIHGGVGFTWEYNVHLFFKRAKSTETFLGSPAYHRELVAQRMGL